jgi:hypothetical protein
MNQIRKDVSFVLRLWGVWICLTVFDLSASGPSPKKHITVFLNLPGLLYSVQLHRASALGGPRPLRALELGVQ